MAWEYQTTRLATSTVTENSWAISRTSMTSSSVVSEGSIVSSTEVQTSAASEYITGRTCFFGTGGAFGSVTPPGTTITLWESWAIETRALSSTSSRSRSFMRTVGTTRSVFTGTGGTKRESSYQTLYDVTLVTEIWNDQYFTGGSSETAFTQRTFQSRTDISYENTSGGVATVTTTFSGETTARETTSFVNDRTYWYSNTTVSTTANTTATVTTTSNQSYTFVSGTTGPATTSASSTWLVTTTQTLATTTGVTSYSSASFSKYVIIDTVVQCGSNDWGWLSTVTTDSAGQVSEVASSFTGDITVPQRAVGLPLTWTPVTVTYTASTNNTGSSGLTTSWQDVFLTRVSTTANFTLRTTQSETYTIGASTNGPNFAPLTTQVTVSVTFTTTTLSNFTFHNTTTTAFGATTNQPISYSAVLFSCPWTITLTTTRTGFDVPTYTTTAAGGSVWDTNNPDQLNSTVSLTQSFSNATISTFRTGYTEAGVTLTGNSHRRFDQTAEHNGTYDIMHYRFSSVSANPPSYIAPAIAGGFQAWGSEGRGSSYYKNLDGGGIPILSFGHIYPNVIVPLMDQESRAYTEGTVTATTRWDQTANNVLLTQQTGTHTSETAASTITISATGSIAMRDSLFTGRSTIGGFGWNTSHTSVLSASQGIHRYTLNDAAGGSTVGFISWSPAASTFGVTDGNAIALETVPKANIFSSQYSTNYSPVMIFSAFPSA